MITPSSFPDWNTCAILHHPKYFPMRTISSKSPWHGFAIQRDACFAAYARPGLSLRRSFHRERSHGIWLLLPQPVIHPDRIPRAHALTNTPAGALDPPPPARTDLPVTGMRGSSAPALVLPSFSRCLDCS